MLPWRDEHTHSVDLEREAGWESHLGSLGCWRRQSGHTAAARVASWVCSCSWWLAGQQPSWQTSALVSVLLVCESRFSSFLVFVFFFPPSQQSCELFILLSKFVCTHLERILFSTVLEVDSLIFASSHAKVSTYLILPSYDQEIKTLVFISISRWGSNFSNLFWRWRRDIGGDFSLQKVGRKV